MNAFVITANPPAAGVEPVIRNDGWFPDIDPAHVRSFCRLDGTVTPERLRPALVDAILATNAELQGFKAEKLAAGHESLAQVPAPTVDGKSANEHHYLRAIHYGLMADLAEAYRNLAKLPDSNNKESHVLQHLVVELDEHRRKQRWAIADLKRKPRVIAELI